jgi:hypothetical protein
VAQFLKKKIERSKKLHQNEQHAFSLLSNVPEAVFLAVCDPSMNEL